jgi:hypothetical protein
VLQLELLLRLARRQRLSLGGLTSGGPTMRGRGTGLPLRPLLAPWYRQVEDGERLLLEHGRSVVVLHGAAARLLLPALLPLLDGSRTLDELVAAVGPVAEPAVVNALELLHEGGLLVEGPRSPEAVPAAEMLAAAYGLAPSLAAERLRAAVVGVAGSGPGAGVIARLLGAAGVGAVVPLEWEEQRAVDLALVVPDPAEAAALHDWNRAALELELPWLPVRPFDGLVAAVGPLVLPGESACFECLLLRMAGHLEWGGDLRRIEQVPLRAAAGSPLETVAAGVAAQIALCWVGGEDGMLPGTLHVLEARPWL